MKMVYTHENQFLVNNVKNLLEGHGITVFIKNEFSQGAIGEISAFDAWPEVWVYDDLQFDTAIEVVESSQRTNKQQDWECSYCLEKNDPSFEVCWNCQKEVS